MASIIETACAEIFARLKAAPAYGGVTLAPNIVQLPISMTNIRRSHRTNVTRENSPAVHLIEGLQKVNEDKRCDWRWEMDGTVSVFVRSDLGMPAADPIIIEVVRRINPEAPSPDVPYSNGVLLQLLEIAPESEIADEDALRVDIRFRLKFGTKRWTSDVPVT